MPEVRLGASPRAVLHLARAAKAAAALDGRPFVVPDDVQRLAVPVLAHRLLLTVEAHASHRSAEEVVRVLLEPDPGAPGWLRPPARPGPGTRREARSPGRPAHAGSRGLTTRGRCLLAGGVAAIVCALVLDERDLLRIGIFAAVLPVIAMVAGSMRRLRLTASHLVSPVRLAPGTVGQVVLSVTTPGPAAPAPLEVCERPTADLTAGVRCLVPRLRPGTRADRLPAHRVQARPVRARTPCRPGRRPVRVVGGTPHAATRTEVLVVPAVVDLSGVPGSTGTRSAASDRARTGASGGDPDVGIRHLPQRRRHPDHPLARLRPA